MFNCLRFPNLNSKGNFKMKQRCPDCGVGVGELHYTECDVERCPDCGNQLLMCGGICIEDGEDPMSPIPWDGYWPGEKECQELGWYVTLVKGAGWIRCDKDAPDAVEDLNRLVTEAKWDKKKAKFVIDK